MRVRAGARSVPIRRRPLDRPVGADGATPVPVDHRSHAGLLSLQRLAGNRAVVELLQRKASAEADFAAAAKIMARLGAGDEKELRQWYNEVAAAFGGSSGMVLKAAKNVIRLSGQSGAPLFKQLLLIAPGELEIYWTLASSLSARYPRFARAVLMVRAFRDPKSGREQAFAEIGVDLPAFLASLPAGEVRKAFAGESLFRLFALFQAARSKVREQVAYALYDRLLASESEAEQFAQEITDDERWAIGAYLGFGEFSRKTGKGRDVSSRLWPHKFKLDIGGHTSPSHRL
jgi:hypothetical protein